MHSCERTVGVQCINEVLSSAVHRETGNRKSNGGGRWRYVDGVNNENGMSQL